MAVPIAGLLRLLRPKQWIKNGFVLAPLVFSGEFQSLPAVTAAFYAALLFCLAASGVYIVNDIHDAEYDRTNPKKRGRPLASGSVSVRAAVMLLVLLYAALALGLVFMPAIAPAVIGYIVLNYLYTFRLKHEPILDIFCVAIGFVLRIYVGAYALGVPVSSWMFVTTLALALYLASLKRRQELSQGAREGRRVLEHYSMALMDRFAEISATGALVFYSIFVMSTRPELVLTVPLVLFGLFRYWYVVEKLAGGDSPTDALLADWQLLGTVVLWVLACMWAIA
jgi:4-hydroxybenzoate polyprenyltransferase